MIPEQSAGQTIFVLDDDRNFVDALVLTLEVAGHDVDAYTSAPAFLDAYSPDRAGCLIADVRMPAMSGLELQRRLAREHSALPIVFVTGHGDIAMASQAFRAGAVDFLEKPFEDRQLLSSVHRALEKDRRERQLVRDRAVVEERYSQLTPRERQIMEFVVSDLTSKEIARQLKISPRTVEHHRAHVMLKMQATSLTELITMAMICGVRTLGI